MRTPCLRGSLLALACASLAPAGLAQVDPNSHLVLQDHDHAPSLSFYDVRLDAEGRPLASVAAAIESARSPLATSARAAEAARLLAEVSGLRIDDHGLFGTPTWVASTLRFLTPAAGGDFEARAVVAEYLGLHRALFEIDPVELEHARVARDFVTRHNGVRHLTFQQQIGGVDLFGCELKANVTRDGALINVSSAMLPRPAEGFATPQAVLDPRDALYLAAASLGIVQTEALVPEGEAVGASRRQTWAPSADFRADVPITSELVWFPRTRSDIRPAWSVVIPEIGVGNTYEMLIDATNGDVLRRWNQLHYLGGTQPITMRVYTKDSPAPLSPGLPTPNGTQAPFVARTLVTINPGDVSAWSPNHWIADGANETLGNNVDAHTDLDANNSPDLPRPQGAPFRVFDFPLDTTQAPSTYRPAAVTQLFYLCNRYHDALYELGFDEPAGNFQTSNFALGGSGNDAVQADCQDGSGTNNANFGTTGSDGSSARMQMYVFTGPTPDRDGDLDADIVYHEYSHGLSIRLHGGLSGTQPQGMGEGWGDFFGVVLNAEPTDDVDGTFHTGGYSTHLFSGLTNNYYFGIRRFPYSTDLNKNPQTYADTDPNQQSYPPGVPISSVIPNTANEVHNVGEVWCNVLLECRAGLWAQHGFAGNHLIQQLVVDGMKLSPGNPTFLQARDAILQSDLVNNGGANLGILWTRFAKRGMGESATSPASTTTSGIVEAYDVPSLVLFTYPSGVPTQFQPGVPNSFQVTVSGLASVQPVAGSGQVFYSVDGGPFLQGTMNEGAPNAYTATLPAMNCFSSVRFYVSTQTTSGLETNPTGAPGNNYPATVYTGVLTAFSDDFETNQNWVATVAGATSGGWQRGVPVNDPSWEYDPATDGDGSGQCYLTQNTAGNTDVDNGSVTLTSPTFDMSSGSAQISYEYYLNLTVVDGVDRLLVEINSNNGAGAWTTIATHATSGGTNWRHHEITSAELSGAGVALTSTMKIRFTANDSGTQSINEAGLDGFKVETLTCSGGVGLAYCAGDGTLATACPCANNGLAGRGCDNSLATGGAQLSGAGTVTPDTVVLTSAGELPSVLSIFLQGTASNANGVVFGDGVRCAAGTLKRLYVKNASSGTASAPAPGDPSITSMSSALGDPIAPGATRYYQVYYRDSDLSFCGAPTGDSFNVSNGLRIVW